MRRELCAGVLLALLLAAAALCLNRVDRLIGRVGAQLAQSEKAADQGDYKGALDALEEALSLWEESQAFTGVFLRHPEVDETGEAFYELMELLLQQDAEALPAAYRRIGAKLRHISAMEHPSVATVF